MLVLVLVLVFVLLLENLNYEFKNEHEHEKTILGALTPRPLSPILSHGLTRRRQQALCA